MRPIRREIMFAHQLEPHRARGFTLVEILVVVVILGIASAIIIPQIGSRDDLIAAAGARVLMSDLIYAQNRAIAVQKPHYVQFVGQQYTLLTRDSDASPLYAITHPITKDPYAVTFGAANSGLEKVAIGTFSFGGPSVLGFDELGSPVAYDVGTNTSTPLATSGTISISCGDITLTVSVEPYTGETLVN